MEYTRFEASSGSARRAINEFIADEQTAKAKFNALERDLRSLGAIKIAVVGNDVAPAAVAFTGRHPEGWQRVADDNIRAPVPFYRPQPGSSWDSRFKDCSASLQIEGLPSRFILEKTDAGAKISTVTVHKDGGKLFLRIPETAGIDFLPGFIAETKNTKVARETPKRRS